MSAIVKGKKRLSFIEMTAIFGNLALLGAVGLIMATV